MKTKPEGRTTPAMRQAMQMHNPAPPRVKKDGGLVALPVPRLHKELEGQTDIYDMILAADLEEYGRD